MKTIERLIALVASLLPFLRRKKPTAQELKEFSELVTGQYEFLMQQLTRVLKDYFEISGKVREMHSELFQLTEKLAKAASQQCANVECKERKSP